MGDKIICLKNKTYLVVTVAVPVSVLVELGGDTVDDKVTVCILVKTADDIKQGGFTAAGRAEDRNKLVLSELKVDTLESFYCFTL